MTSQEVRRRLSAVPFRPFEMCLADGRILSVEHPDLLGFEDGVRTVILFKKVSSVEAIDLRLVLSIRFENPDFVHSGPPPTSEKSDF